MKELKDFLKDIDDSTLLLLTKVGDVITVEDARRIVSEAYIAGMNFQEAQKK